MPLTDEQQQQVIEQWDKTTPDNRARFLERYPQHRARLAPPSPAPTPSGQAAPQSVPVAAAQPRTPPTIPTLEPQGARAVQQEFGGAQTPAPPGILPPARRVPENLDTPPPILEPDHLRRLAKSFGINFGLTYGLGALGAATGPFAGAAIPLGAMAGSLAARQLNKYLEFEEPGMTGDILAGVGPLAPSLAKGAKEVAKLPFRYGRAGQALRTADEANQVAQLKYTTDVHEARSAAAAANQRLQQAYQQKNTTAITTAYDNAVETWSEYRRKMQHYADAVKGQQQAVTQARAVPGAFTPPIDPATLYNDFARQFGPQAVTMTDAQQAAYGVLKQLGGHFEALQQPRLQAIATEMLTANNPATVATVHQYLKDLGPLTRSTNSTVRGAAKQLYAGLQDSLTTAPGATPALKQANAAARREFALDDLERLIRRAVSTGNDGLPRLAAGHLVDRVRLLGDENPLFRGSFTQQEWQTLMGNLEALTGRASIPATVPEMPPLLPGAATPRPSGPPPPTVQPKTITPPVPEQPKVKPLNPWRLTAEMSWPAADMVMRGHIGPYTAVAGSLAVIDVVGYGTARILTQPNMQPILRRMIEPGGRIDPRVVAVFNAALQETLGPLGRAGTTQADQ